MPYVCIPMPTGQYTAYDDFRKNKTTYVLVLSCFALHILIKYDEYTFRWLIDDGFQRIAQSSRETSSTQN